MLIKDQLLRLGQKAAIYGIGNILNRFISFLLLPLFTRYLTPTDYGISSILAWMAFLVTPIFSLGIGAAMAPCYFQDDNSPRKRATIWSAFSILLLTVSILFLIGIPSAKFWSSLAFTSPDYHYLVRLSIFSTGLSILSTPFILYLQYEERAKLYAAFTIITTIISIGLNILLVVVFRRGVQGIIEGGFITQVINFLLFLSPAVKELKFRFEMQISHELLKLGVPLIPAFAFLFILQQGNRYILQLFGGLEQVGIYTIGYNFGLVNNIPLEALNIAWVPFFMSFMERRNEASMLFGRIVSYYIVGFGFISLMFHIFAKPIVILMTQPAFHGAYKVVGLTASAYFFSGLFSMLLPGMYFAKEVKYVSLVQGLAAIFGISANFLLISRFQILGAGLGLLFGFICLVLFTMLWNWRRKSYYLKVQYEWKRIALWFVVYCVYIILLQWNRNFSLPGEIAFSLIALVPLPIFIYFVILTSWERKNLKELLKQRGIKFPDTSFPV